MSDGVMKFSDKVKRFEELTNSHVIDKEALRGFCTSGIPDGGGRRSLGWKILLNYLPEEINVWKEYLAKHRSLYGSLIEEILTTPNLFFKDNEVLLQVDKDVRRLCPDISFFSQRSLYPLEGIMIGKYDRLHHRVQQKCLTSQTVERRGLGISKLSESKKKAAEDYAPLGKGEEAHWEVVERILFIYAKLNPGQSYVQGMNEIIGPIYYVFASDPNKEWAEFAEADTFFCFTNLMSDIRDFFIKTLDESETGINGMMIKLMNRIKQFDSGVEKTLVAQGIRPQYFSFRWLSLMLSQEFPLPDVLRIWDSRCYFLLENK
ncbi:TBC domain-containing protein C1952.17c,TBC1 domain family member 13 [Lepeophtheirus salmonis]|uniref:TBC domain-containing protein C1952.17c,TBC1 domain family member 13 n=1 Tax=Lepeophtheirus salmonis TaxID=72036 RepID=A0A7R8H0X7_LEPSM|nr:TBC domain-containing protein C1952.17c,TBC1 domain family member 13 [Lepeophtheirus salmonis]CAF2777780.1 TBC domain-containing protein C1952.17c,TBC1 domain family member 13 [Lepeophtheirus salmonis]